MVEVLVSDARKIVPMPGTPLSPAALLAQVLERATAGQVKACALVTMDHDGIVRFGWSRMQHVECAGLVSYLMYEAMKDPEDA